MLFRQNTMAPSVSNKENEEEGLEKSAIDEELSDLAVDLLLLSQELINTKLKLESLSKVRDQLVKSEERHKLH